MSYGLLLLRLVIGGVMAAHGSQKLFGWFGGGGIDGTATMFASVGFRPPRPYAMLAGAAELLGGLLLAIGFLTPLGAAAVMGMMLAAIGTVHGPKGFSNTKGGWEFNVTLAIAAGRSRSPDRVGTRSTGRRISCLPAGAGASRPSAPLSWLLPVCSPHADSRRRGTPRWNRADARVK